MLVLVVACGGSAPATEPDPTQATTGGETNAEPAPVVRTTTPVPMPQPPIAREQLSEPLQRLWDRTERTVAIRPPEPPAETTMDAVREWAAGPFTEWMSARTEATREAENDVAFLRDAPPHERAVAAALFGYVYEDTAAGVRGAPVPSDVAGDAELLEEYVAALREALLPHAQAAAEAYAACAATIRDDPDRAWDEWRAYCVDRGREMIEVYELPIERAGDDGAAQAPPVE